MPVNVLFHELAGLLLQVKTTSSVVSLRNKGFHSKSLTLCGTGVGGWGGEIQHVLSYLRVIMVK